MNLSELDRAIVRETLADLRREHEITQRVYDVPQEAVEAARLMRLRLAWLRGER